LKSINSKFQSKKVLSLSFGHFAHDVYSAFLAPLLPLLVTKFGISLSIAGTLDAVRNSPSLINPFLGLMADRVSIKYFVILTPAITAVCMSLLGLAPSFTVVFILIFVSGISGTLFHIPAPVMIKEFSGNKTGKGMSWYMLGGEFSRTVGPLLITGAITLWGMEGAWRLIPFGILASFLLYLKLKDFTPESFDGNKKEPINVKSALKELMPLLTFLGFYFFFLQAMKIAVTLYLPAYLMSRGKTLLNASFLLSVLQFSGAAGTLFAGSISDKIGRKATLLISALVCPVIMWLFMTAPEALFIPLLAGLGFFLFASGPVLLALVQDSGRHYPSFANSLYMTISFCVKAFIVFFMGHFIETVGFVITYKAAAILAIGVIPVVLTLKTSPDIS